MYLPRSNFDVSLYLFIYYLSVLFVSLVVSEEPVWRDQFYNGNVIKERGKTTIK